MGPFEDAENMFKAGLWELSKLKLIVLREVRHVYFYFFYFSVGWQSQFSRVFEQNEVEIGQMTESQLADAQMLLSVIRPSIEACHFLYEEMASLNDIVLSGEHLLS